ncbi:MAG: hypothetical protein ACLFV6_14975 [Spirulinaceae cyanobacterium]
MKLSVDFYTVEQEMNEVIKFNPNFQQWLSQSALFQIGKEEPQTMHIAGQAAEKLVVSLDDSVRSKMIDFLHEAIIEETKDLLFQIEDLAIHDELTYRIGKLIEILECVKNQQYYYLQRRE